MAFPLTADICAHGIVAAARYEGCAPDRCVIAKRGPARSALVFAAVAAARLTGLPKQTIARVFKVHPASLSRAERESTKATDRAIAAASQAMVAAGIDQSAGAVPVKRGNVARPAGTVVAPPAAQEAPAAPRVDHTPAILEAMSRRRERIGRVPFEVVGVEADKALIGSVEPGGCVWPMGDPREPGYRSCQAETLSGRLYCAEHLRKAGMKPVPKAIETVGRVADPYVVREAG